MGQDKLNNMQKTKNFSYSDIDNLIAKTNSQIGFLKNYNCIFKMIFKNSFSY